MQEYQVVSEKRICQQHSVFVYSSMKDNILLLSLHSARSTSSMYTKIQDTKTLFLITKTSHKITIVKPNIFYIIYDT